MRALTLSESWIGEASIEVFDIVEPVLTGAWRRDGDGAGALRLWVARHEDRVVAAVTVAFPRVDTATIHCDLLHDTAGPGVAEEFLAAAFKHCRDRGVLKIIIEGRWEGVVQAAAEAAGIAHSCTKTRDGFESAELYINLYRPGLVPPAAAVRERIVR